MKLVYGNTLHCKWNKCELYAHIHILLFANYIMLTFQNKRKLHGYFYLAFNFYAVSFYQNLNSPTRIITTLSRSAISFQLHQNSINYFLTYFFTDNGMPGSIIIQRRSIKPQEFHFGALKISYFVLGCQI